MDDLNVLTHRLAALRGDIEDARRIEAAVRTRLEANPALSHERWSTAVSAAELDLRWGTSSPHVVGSSRCSQRPTRTHSSRRPRAR